MEVVGERVERVELEEEEREGTRGMRVEEVGDPVEEAK